MTQAEILQAQVMDSFWKRLTELSDSELMTRRQAEMELQHDMTRINAELDRRCAEL